MGASNSPKKLPRLSRNVLVAFLVMRPGSPKGPRRQPFKLELTPELCGDRPLSLYTELVSGTSWSRVTHHQEVTAVDRATAGLVWRALCSSLEYRMEMEGTPVQANVALVLGEPPPATPPTYSAEDWSEVGTPAWYSRLGSQQHLCSVGQVSTSLRVRAINFK